MAVLILGVQDRATAVTVYSIIGNIRSFQGVYSHQRLRRPLIDHLSTS